MWPPVPKAHLCLPAPPSEGPGSGAELSAGARVRQLLLPRPVLRAAPSCLPLVLSEGHFLFSPWCE